MEPISQETWPAPSDTRPRRWTVVDMPGPGQDVVTALVLASGVEDGGRTPETWRLSWFEWVTTAAARGLTVEGAPHPLAAAWEQIRESAAADPAVAAIRTVLAAVADEVGTL